ncbi:RNA polymerase sigma factor [Methylomonas montana]|uniref:RNA polymerase sigma factor n=1 Tax=Methylomonas montana TaxID=3058963 RepID=UPI002659154F|nr:RNA polymerase sigma factor [Methylomonas montana]WKJ90295.1 RNA polymerase sigma factor [Methylomonas montana]
MSLFPRMTTTGKHHLLTAFLSHQHELLQFLTYKVSCAETAADLIQETYLRVARHPGDGEIVNLRAFVFRIADNLALDHLRSMTRRDKRDGGSLSEEIVCQQAEPDRILAGQQQMELFENFIYALPPQCRTVFLLCRVDGKSYSEIAAELNISPRTVESHMHKALKLLKQRIELC